MAEGTRVYVGTYTKGESEGIYLLHQDASTGALGQPRAVGRAENPAFLTIAPRGRYLYAVSEIAGAPGGAVSAFAIDVATGDLTFLNQQPTGGTSPCHLSVDETSRFVLVANYGGGSVCMFPIQDDGRLGDATDLVEHEGSSVNPKRQEGPHAHSISIGPGNAYALAADLGVDKILVYRLDLTEGRLVPNDPPWAEVHAGAGPRHLDFHPNGRYAYVINELDNTIIGFAYDQASGTLRELQTVPTLPDDFDAVSHCADIHVHPSGRFVYGSNRGHDSIVVYAIDEETGGMTYVARESTQIKEPRNFAIDPSGTFLLVANQNSDTIVTFRIDQQTGQLELTDHVVRVPMPVCLKFVS